MDRRAALSLPRGCRRGITLLEVVVCLAVLGVFLTGFVRHLGGTAASAARLEEREKAERLARTVRALLSAEDPWAAPESRMLTLDETGAPAAPGPRAYQVRITGAVLCAGGPAPPDDAGAPRPGRCADGSRAVRRWRVLVSYSSLYGDAPRDSVLGDFDVDAASTTAVSPFGGITP